MTDDKRFTIKSQDDYFGITDNNVEDKMNVINGIHTEIEAKWLCDLLNSLAEDNKMLNRMIDKRDGWNNLAHEQLFKLGKENEQLKSALKELNEENQQIKSTIKEAYQNERTMIGKSVLKQLMETTQ